MATPTRREALQTLGLDSAAADTSSESVKRAYLQKARSHHPDVGGSKETFQRIASAYERLMSSDRRVRSAAEHYEQMMARRAKEPAVIRALFRCGGAFWQLYGVAVAVVVVAAVVEDQQRPKRRR